MSERNFLSILDRLFRQKAKVPISEPVSVLLKKPPRKREDYNIDNGQKITITETSRLNRAREDAQTWVEQIFADEKIDSQAKDKTQNARKRIEGEKYPDDVLSTAKDRWEAAEPALLEKAPSWLQAESIHQSTVAAEFVLRITSFPSELQTDPNVLLYEASKAYWSTKWEALSEAEAGEMRHLIGRVVNEARYLSNDKGIGRMTDKSLVEKLFGRDESVKLLSDGELDKGPALFDSTTPAERIHPDVASKLEEIQKQISISPEAWETDQQFLDDILNLQVRGQQSFRQFAEDPSRISDDKFNKHIQLFMNRILKQRHRVGENIFKGQKKIADESNRPEFSTIYLQKEEEEKLLHNLDWEIEKYARRQEETSVLYPDTPVAEAAKRRLELVSAYASHDQFQIDARSEKNLTELGFNPDLSKDDSNRDRYLDYIRNAPNRISEKISNRSNIQIAYGAVKSFGDPEQIQKATTAVGTKGLEFLLRENGGMVDVAVNKIAHVLGEAYKDKNGELRRYTPQVIEAVEKQVVDEMYEDRGLYEEMYAKAFSVPGISWEKHKLDKKTIESIVRLAGYHNILTERNLVSELRGLGPGETIGDESSFLSAGTDDKILGAMDINRWFFEKWTNLKDGQLFIWRSACRVAAKISGRDKVAEEKFSEIKALPGNERLVKIAKAFMIDPRDIDQAEKAGAIERALQRELRFSRGGKERHNTPKRLEDISDRDLKDRLVVLEGERTLGEILGMYDHYSSGWRAGTVVRQIESIWGTNTDRKDAGLVMGLGFRLRRAGYNVVEAQTKADKDASIKGLKETLKNVADYRPQALFEYLSDEVNPAAKAWFAENKTLLDKVFKDQKGNIVAVNHAADLQKYIGRPFIAINEQLAENGQPPINYLEGATPAQTVIVTKICKAMNIDEGSYVEMMKKMSTRMGKPDLIDELTKDRYSWIYTRTRWIDDARLRFLESPENAPGGLTVSQIKETEGGRQLIVGEERVPLSRRFTVEGVGAGDPLPRTWADTNTGVKTVSEIYAALTADQKTYFEKIKTIFDAVSSYSGSKPSATRSILYFMSGWAETARTTKDVKDLFLSFIYSKQSTSAFQELFGHAAASMSPNELEEFIDQHGVVLGTRLKLMVPEDVYQIVEEDLGIASPLLKFGEKKFLFGKWPLYRYRVGILILISSALIAMEINKQVSGSSSGGSH